MRLEIIPREKLTENQAAYLRERVAAKEHEGDPGPKDWDKPYLSQFFFIVLYRESSQPIGILYRGLSKTNIRPSWWLDRKYRGRKLGYEMIDLFACELKKEGVTHIGSIPIESYRGQENIASEKLAKRLKRYFENGQ